MALRQRHFLPLELIMFPDPITVTALAAPLTTETTGDHHVQPCSRLISEAYAQT